MAEDDQAEPRRHGRFWRRVIAGLVVCLALLVLLHRPILLSIGRKIVLNYATKHNLKADFRAPCLRQLYRHPVDGFLRPEHCAALCRKGKFKG